MKLITDEELRKLILSKTSKSKGEGFDADGIDPSMSELEILEKLSNKRVLPKTTKLYLSWGNVRWFIKYSSGIRGKEFDSKRGS
ncbi:hypothetical protein [Ammoniphilus sp. CFH 90114]|uniref:hypothetical protein n=1 Tax=Ammoniphilus sp. CFH 90114 TaxID=2493665 RepID=UPI00100F568B|nr:hypothetical protein [Ammoniphilus sp. CFH 90114]RXT04093.1 hypothetical protein EIZ39_21170 [Ammoniphilus sp. CFH 90114]